MSLRNATNIKTKKMNIVESINDNLKWPRISEMAEKINTRLKRPQKEVTLNVGNLKTGVYQVLI
jgi:hypothetical protein